MGWGGWVVLTVLIGLVLVQLTTGTQLPTGNELDKITAILQCQTKEEKVLLQLLLSFAQLSPNLCALINFDRKHRTVTFHFNIDFLCQFQLNHAILSFHSYYLKQALK